MKIFVKSLTGKTITVYIEEKETIKILKERICDSFEIPPEKQTLIFKGITLEDENPISLYRIIDGSIINLIRKINDEDLNISVNVFDLKNNSIIIEINPLESIKKFKSLIEEKTRIPASQQILNFNGEILEDSETLDYYDIDDDSNIKISTSFVQILTKQSDKNEDLKERIFELEKQLEITKNENILLKKKIESLEDYIKTNEMNKEKELKNKYKKSDNDDFKVEELFKLMKQLREKEEEIKQLKSTRQFDLKPNEKLISVIFISTDQKIHFSLICKNTDIFSTVENSLYKEFPEYKESENYFLLNGVKINKYKSLIENNIKNSSIITLNKYD